ncbi:MAG: U32 family peptidase [Bacteroidales bacterium]|nr:U32 family peptidase [Bacteroidales bacterium]MDD4217289.1 U32 family peptidase [Bacteroidales bacterium]MDY0140607.1 peptidase U32 family protein [Bacteroidales bacterium]
MKRKIELLAPGGDIDSIKAAIIAGADAVYCGLDRFNARNRAVNISFEDLRSILRLAHKNNCQVFLTLNILILENEIPALVKLLNKLANTSIDGIIVQDLGLLYILSNYFKNLKIHASTQLTTHNEDQIEFLSKLNVSRVNLSRELNTDEIKHLGLIGKKNNISTEIFVHGSNCISFSGLCYLSSLHSGNSGNRGRCSQPCRDRYLKTEAGKNYPLNLKDNSAYFNLKEIVDAGVKSIKIEGRIKKSDYVYTVVNAWKNQINSLFDVNELLTDNSDLYKVFNRDFSNAFLIGDISKNMFIDNPRDHSIQHLSEINRFYSDSEMENAATVLYNEKDEIKENVEKQINDLSISKTPLQINISGQNGSALIICVISSENSFTLQSKTKLILKPSHALTAEILLTKLKAINETEFYIENLNLQNLQPNLFISFHELTSLKKRILSILNDSKEILEPITLPVLKNYPNLNTPAKLSVLINSEKDLNICNETDANIYFQLPACLKNGISDYENLFAENKKLIPWFPSVIIGKDYDSAVQLLSSVKPSCIVTNNLGIAYQAYRNGIKWIAGPYLNIINSYSLINLKENLNCVGAFISNEINQNQIKSLNKPDEFKLFYSIYHPIVLMTSRQCLFHQVTGCEKHRLDDDCMIHCSRSATITNLKNQTLIIEKSPGNYHKIYNAENYLNTDIITDIPNMFSEFLIDLCDVKTETIIATDKSEIVKYLQNIINGQSNIDKKLNQIISKTTKIQYKKGI